MRSTRKVFASVAVLWAIALLTSAYIWGEPAAPGDPGKRVVDNGGPDKNVLAAFDAARFAERPVITYKGQDGATYFALQIKPELKAPAQAQPRDYVILVSTAASMAQGELALATKVVEEIIKNAPNDDNFSILTVNTTVGDLTKGLVPASKLDGAMKSLKAEVPLGTGDLKKAIEDAEKLIPERRGRQRVILYMGNGKSVVNPIGAAERAKLSDNLVAKKIAFFSIPMGINMEPANLHGFATATGGRVVRFKASDKPEESLKATLTELANVLAVPVLYADKGLILDKPEKDNLVDVLPSSKLPPLRADVPTLVAGKMKVVPEKLTYKLSGTVAGKAIEPIQKTEKVTQPDTDFFFLPGLVAQWANDKDRPALMQADRLLCMAFDNAQMAKADLLTQAEMAMQERKFEAAAGIFQQVLGLDPSNAEAKAGHEVMEKLKDGKIDLKQLEERLKVKPGDKNLRFDPVEGKLKEVPVAQDAPAPDALQPPKDNNQLLEDAKRRQQLEDQRTSQLLDEAIRRAQKVMQVDPERAREDLKRDLDTLLSNQDLSQKMRDALTLRAEAARRDIDVRGREIQRQIDQRLRDWQLAVERQKIQDARKLEEDRIAVHMMQFHDLMDKARDEEAWKLMRTLSQELVDKGLPVPPAVTAAYRVGLTSQNLREYNTLRTARQEQFLAVQMQIERSFMPFPDEPPIVFPPAEKWKILTEKRKARFGYMGFGAEMPPAAFKLQDLMATPVHVDPAEGKLFEDQKTTIKEALDWLAVKFKFSYEINEKAFEFAGGKAEDRLTISLIGEKGPFPVMNDVSLSTVLQKILSRMGGEAGGAATWMIRRDHIEITTVDAQINEKSIRVFPVLDLVLPTPGNIASQIQTTIFGGTAYGQIGGQLQFGGLQFGGMQFGGMQFGGQLGGFQFGGQLGGLQFGGLQLGGLQFGGQLGLQFGGQLGLQIGGLQFGGQLGLQIGGLQFGGLQFGGIGGLQFQGGLQQGLQSGMNLGGVYGGFLGGNQANILTYLVRNLVGEPRDWDVPKPPPGIAFPGQPNPNPQPEDDLPTYGNQLGFYGPVGALVVKGTSRITSRAASPFNGKGPGSPLAFDDNKKLGAGSGAVADAHEKRDPNKVKLPPGISDMNPKTVWQEALVQGAQDPTLLIACWDTLATNRKWDDASEFLKANLRMGLVVEPWVFQSLAIALRESKASPEEIERAELSSVDLQPQDAQGYIKAAEVMRELQHYDRAGALLKQAAILEPELPQTYKTMLVCAEQGKDSELMMMAVKNLLRRDWPVDNAGLQTEARTRADALIRTLDSEGRKQDLKQLSDLLQKQAERDVRIKANWQGNADYDLKVEEPNGSICSFLNRLTVGGGTLLGGGLKDGNSEEYVAAEGFSGEYKVSVERRWGQSISGKVQIVITVHDGTGEKTTRIENIKPGETFTVKLDNGRRKSAASVPPPSSFRKTPPQLEPSAGDIYVKMRDMAEAAVTGVDPMRGGVGAPGQQTPRNPDYVPKGTAELDKSAYQTKVPPSVQNSIDMTLKAVVSPDKSEVRLTLTPMFNDPTKYQQTPVVNNPLVPGGK
jgi:tetratricopeptide (TPR) repeat protein